MVKPQHREHLDGQTRLALLTAMLRGEIEATEVYRGTFAGGFQSPSGTTDSFRILLVESGQLKYIVGGQSLKVGAGGLMLIPPGLWRRWEVVSESEAVLSWCIIGTPKVPVDVSMPICRQAEGVQEHATMQRLGEQFRLVPDRAARLYMEGEVKAMLARMLAPTPHPRPAGGRRQSDLAIARATQWIREHFAEDDVLSALHARVDLSEKFFARRFKALEHVTPHQYLVSVRMREARRLLRNDCALVKQVAMAVGYSDPFHFSRLYRKHWGHPPSDEAAAPSRGVQE